MSELPAYYPEVRDGPPWVMEDMIAAEPGLASIAARPSGDVEAIAAAVTSAARDGRSVVVVGSGTAEHAAYGVAEILEEAVRSLGYPAGLVLGREAFEAALDPRSGGVCVAVSHSSRSAQTVRALEAAKLNEARTVLITADADDTPATAFADLVFTTPLVDRSFCHTVGYLAPLIVAGVLAGEIGDVPVGADDLRRALDAADATGADARAVGAALEGAGVHVTTGSGADQHAARELALKIEEGLRAPSAMRGLETLMHGHFVAMDEQASLVALCTDRRARLERAKRTVVALQAARRLGIRTTVITTTDVADHFTSHDVSDGVIAVEDEATLPAAVASLIATAAPLQHLTVGLVRTAGVNPDLIRREELPYREVSMQTETKIR